MLNLIANVRDLVRAAFDEITVHFPGDRPLSEETESLLCAVPKCRRRAPHGRLCDYGPVGRDGIDGGHFAELGRWLHDIEDEAARLDAAPSMSTRWDRAGGSSLASLRAPALLDPIVHTDPRSSAHGWQHVGPVCASCHHWSCDWIRADYDEHGARAERPLYVLGVLNDIAQRVRDERMLGLRVRPALVRVPPGHEGVYVVDRDGVIGATTLVPDPPTIASERELLTRHLVWISEQPWVADIREQLGELRAQLMRANGNQDDQPLTGYCYKVVDDHGTECRGNLWPVYTAHTSGGPPDEDDGPLRPREVVCDRNPAHRWKGGRGGDLARLAIVLEQQNRANTAVAPAPAPPAPPRLRLLHDPGAGDRLAPVLEQQHLEGIPAHTERPTR